MAGTWKAANDPITGKAYYYDDRGNTTWSLPPPSPPPPPPPPPPPRPADGMREPGREHTFPDPLAGIYKVDYTSANLVCSICDGAGVHEEPIGDFSSRLARELLQHNSKASVAKYLTDTHRKLGVAISSLANQGIFGKLVGRPQSRVSEVLRGTGTNPDRQKISEVLIMFAVLNKAGVSAAELLRLKGVESEIPSPFNSPSSKAAGRAPEKTSPVINPHYTKILEVKWARDGGIDKAISPEEREAIAIAIWNFISKLQQPVESDIAVELQMGQAAYVAAAKDTIGTWWSYKKTREKARRSEAASKRQRSDDGTSTSPAL